jgi:hypothetical protein
MIAELSQLITNTKLALSAHETKDNENVQSVLKICVTSSHLLFFFKVAVLKDK